jgi:hypothetical protein
VVCGTLKLAYDLTLVFSFGRIKPAGGKALAEKQVR